MLHRILAILATLALLTTAPAKAQEPKYDATCHPTGSFALTFPESWGEEEEKNEALEKLMQERLVTLRFNRLPSPDGIVSHIGSHPARYTTGNAFIDELWGAAKAAAKEHNGSDILQSNIIMAEAIAKANLDEETINYIRADFTRLSKMGIKPAEALRVISYDLRMAHLHQLARELSYMSRSSAQPVLVRHFEWGKVFSHNPELCSTMTEGDAVLDLNSKVLKFMPHYATMEYRFDYELVRKTRKAAKAP